MFTAAAAKPKTHDYSNTSTTMRVANTPLQMTLLLVHVIVYWFIVYKSRFFIKFKTIDRDGESSAAAGIRVPPPFTGMHNYLLMVYQTADDASPIIKQLPIQVAHTSETLSASLSYRLRRLDKYG